MSTTTAPKFHHIVLLAMAILLFCPAVSDAQNQKNRIGLSTVVIDPGHGGSSSGAVLGDRQEKDDNLRLSLLVRDILVERGYTVVMTRDGDTDVSLEDRCKIANKAKASLFVSIHRFVVYLYARKNYTLS